MVPVVRHAEARDLWDSAKEVARLAAAARAGKIARDELTGSTITLTRLGPLGGIVTTPVINAPEVAIIGINRIVERPAIVRGAMVARSLMNLSSSFDHRVIDGQNAAEFVQVLRGYLECPGLLFVEQDLRLTRLTCRVRRRHGRHGSSRARHAPFHFIAASPLFTLRSASSAVFI